MKVRFITSVFAGGNEYHTSETYEVDKQTYEWLKEYCELVEEIKQIEEAPEDKAIRKAKNK